MAIIPQTATAQFPAIAYAGMLADGWLGSDISSAVVSEATGVEAGIAVIEDGAPTLVPGYTDKVKLPVDATSVVIGFTVYKSMKEPGSPRFALYDSVNLLKKGRIWVLAQATVVKGDDVYAWYSTGSTKGSIRADAGSTQAVKVRGARVILGASAAGFALVDFNWPQASADNAYVAGGSWNITAVKTTAYTAVIGDEVRTNTTAAAFTVTLPTAVGQAGRAVKVVDVNGTWDTNNLTVATTSAQTIDGAATKVLSTEYGETVFTSDGANWFAS